MATDRQKKDLAASFLFSDEDIYAAMKEAGGYLDITPTDLKELYRHAYRHALDRITSAVRARDIMTSPVITVQHSTPLAEVAAVMAENAISGVPVLGKDGAVAGVISGKDFLKSMSGSAMPNFMSVIAECLKGSGCLVGPIRAKRAEEIMSAPAVSVSEETTGLEIARIFENRGINRVPVTDSHGMITGIVSRADIVSLSAALMRRQ